jgi:hypothetical protein
VVASQQVKLHSPLITQMTSSLLLDVNAYQNYGMYVQRQQGIGGVPCGMTPQEALQRVSYSEPPPSYEDTMKQSSGVINAVSLSINKAFHTYQKFSRYKIPLGVSLCDASLSRILVPRVSANPKKT